MNCPCKLCSSRTTGERATDCHSSCEKYFEWKEYKRKRNERERKEHPYYSYSREKHIKNNLLRQKAGRM